MSSYFRKLGLSAYVWKQTDAAKAVEAAIRHKGTVKAQPHEQVH